MSTNDTASHDLEQLTKDQFRDVIGRFASGVTVVTVEQDGKPLGTTASAFTSLSDEPPMILVCMNKTSETGMAIHKLGNFAVNILGESHPDLAMRFAGKGADKFEGVAHEPGVDGEPLLIDALATLECTVTEETSGGTHLVFLASVDRASAKPGAPLTYFRGKFGRFQQSEDEAVTPQPMEDWIAAQRTIEIGVAMQRAGNIKAEEIAECERLLDLMDAAQDGPIEPWIETLDSYLDYFVSLSGSPSLQSAYRRRDVAAVPSAHATATHRRVLKAMQENDPQTAFKEIEDRTRGGI